MIKYKNKDIESVLGSEGISENDLRRFLSEGSAVICKNRKRDIKPLAFGKGLRTKVNANIGASADRFSMKEEIKKAWCAVQAGADAIMDLSTGGNIREVRRAVMSEVPVCTGTVPLYEVFSGRPPGSTEVASVTDREIIDTVSRHCEDGVDFLTLHCGVTRSILEKLREQKRVMGCVSRGGSIMLEWMAGTGKENPLFSMYDEILDILKDYDAAISLGDGLRPGAIADSTDIPQVEELKILGELVLRAREKGVRAFVEGPGHVPLHDVARNMRLQKEYCHDAPFYVLGPLVTDRAAGHDHIAAAIGGAVAAMEGADFLCYVTPAEHLRLPDISDVREGVIASRIAAHAGDIAKQIPGAAELDLELSRARREMDWETMFRLCIDPNKAVCYRDSLKSDSDEQCSMCGDFCAVRRSSEINI
ncbi:MAG: phosphomethylpyrimidine synthase ThiC [Fibrobacterota bacterium]